MHIIRLPPGNMSIDHTDQTDHTDHTDQQSTCPEKSTSRTTVGIDRTDHTDHLTDG